MEKFDLYKVIQMEYYLYYSFEVINYKIMDGHCSNLLYSNNFCETIFYTPCMNLIFIFQYLHFDYPRQYSLNLQNFALLYEYLSFLHFFFFDFSLYFQKFIYLYLYFMINYLMMKAIKFHKIHLISYDSCFLFIHLGFYLILDVYY